MHVSNHKINKTFDRMLWSAQLTGWIEKPNAIVSGMDPSSTAKDGDQGRVEAPYEVWYCDACYCVGCPVPALAAAANRENRKSVEGATSARQSRATTTIGSASGVFHIERISTTRHTFKVEGQEFENMDSVLAETRVQNDKAQGTAGDVPRAEDILLGRNHRARRAQASRAAAHYCIISSGSHI